MSFQSKFVIGSSGSINCSKYIPTSSNTRMWETASFSNFYSNLNWLHRREIFGRRKWGPVTSKSSRFGGSDFIFIFNTLKNYMLYDWIGILRFEKLLGNELSTWGTIKTSNHDKLKWMLTLTGTRWQFWIFNIVLSSFTIESTQPDVFICTGHINTFSLCNINNREIYCERETISSSPCYDKHC